ncbi:MAG TPA: sulfotransferase [Gaiellaceae bacterium]
MTELKEQRVEAGAQTTSENETPRVAAAPGSVVAVTAAAPRDSMRHAPVFVLAPARSNSSVVTAMLGQHPDLCVFPELALFRKNTVDDLLTDPPGWKGPATRLRLAGVFRALAENQGGGQTPESVAAAERWVAARRSWHVGDLLDHLLDLAAPLVGIEKSPENSSREEYLVRLNATYPRARYLHLSRHPLPSILSMHRAWSEKGYWKIDPELFHHFCVGVWYYQHARITRFFETLPPDRGFRVRSEDVVNDPEGTLPAFCRWLGIDAGPEAIEAMSHPERSPYAQTGPEGALGGWDAGFMKDPALRKTEIPGRLEFPQEWIVDPWLGLATFELASRLGY